MDRKRVLDALDVLNAELARSDRVSEDARAALERVTADIRQLLEERAAPSIVDTEAASALKESLLAFEAEHPQMTGAINQLAAALANLGI